MNSNDKKIFCLLPFIHIKIGPTSKVQPCCMYDYYSYIGDLNNESIKSIWNGVELKKIRMSFLNGIIPEGCKKCFSSNHPYRNNMNNFLSRFSNIIQSIKNDGEIDIKNLVSLDLRMSNLCNLKCRMCNHASSSALYENDLQLKLIEPRERIIRMSNDMALFDRQLEEIIPNLYHVYLTGGEPLINKRNYELLDKFISNKQFDIHISYNSNLNELNYRNIDILELWKNFSDVSIYASIDAINEKAEYIRHGSNWNKIMANIQKIKMNFKNSKTMLNFNTTLSVYNAYDILNLHKLLIEDFLIDDANIDFFYLYTPDYLDIRILPYAIKKDIEEKYNNFKKYLIRKKYFNLAKNYRYAIQYIFSNDKSNCFYNFKNFTKKLDKIRKESFAQTFPEFMKYKEFTDIKEIISWQEKPKYLSNNEINKLLIRYEVSNEEILHVNIFDKDWNCIYGMNRKLIENSGTAVFELNIKDIIPGKYILKAELRNEKDTFENNIDEIYEEINIKNTI